MITSALAPASECGFDGHRCFRHREHAHRNGRCGGMVRADEMGPLRVAGVSATTGPERGRRLEGWSVRRIVGHVRIQDLSLQEDYRGQPNRAADLHLRAVLVGQVCAAGRHSMRVGGEVVGPLCVGCLRRRCACRDRSAASAQVGRLCAGRLRGLRAARAVGVLCVAVAVHVPGTVVAGRRPGCGVPTGRCPLRSGPGRPIMRAAGSRGWRRLAPPVAGLARPGRRLMRGSWPPRSASYASADLQR